MIILDLLSYLFKVFRNLIRFFIINIIIIAIGGGLASWWWYGYVTNIFLTFTKQQHDPFP